MLLQLSTKLGINTETVTSWLVEEGLVTAWFSNGHCVKLNRDEGLAFLRHVEATISVRFEMRAILLGKETDG